RAAPECGIHAFACRVHPRASPRHHRTLVWDEDGIDGDHPEEGGPGSTHAATDARSYRLHVTPRGWERRPRQASSRIESGWMSILAPVSLAARRAFWPSLPIASDSW